MTRSIADLAEVRRRYQAQIDRSDPSGCWIWTGRRNRGGYGVVKIGGRMGKTWLVHRWAYEDQFGPIPEGLCLCHRCDNPPCQNPDHWFLGTRRENNDDRVAKARTATRARHGFAKLTEDEVASIRRRVETGTTQAAICREFGLASSTVSVLVRRRTWRDPE